MTKSVKSRKGGGKGGGEGGKRRERFKKKDEGGGGEEEKGKDKKKKPVAPWEDNQDKDSRIPDSEQENKSTSSDSEG